MSDKLESVALYTESLDGHRQSYLDLFSDLLSGYRENRFKILKTSDVVLFLMIEENFAFYIFACIYRAFQGKRTAGLLFRPLPTILAPTLRLKIKKLCLVGLMRFRNIKTICLLPHYEHTNFEKICNSWIYDPQLWDLKVEDFNLFKSAKKRENLYKFTETNSLTQFRDKIDSKVSGKLAVASLGGQTPDKGLEEFSMQLPKIIDSSVLLISAGKFPNDGAKYCAALEEESHYVINRLLTNEEMIVIYGLSDLIWCFYSVHYDQASGILGRSAQLGVPVLVREGSLNDKLCKFESIPHISLKSISDFDQKMLINFESPTSTETRTSRMRSESIRNLELALFDRAS